MTFAEEFAVKLKYFITESLDEFSANGYKVYRPDTLEYLLVHKPILKLMKEFTLDEAEKKSIDHKLIYETRINDNKLLMDALRPLSNTINKYYGRISEETMIKQVYSNRLNKAINLVYEALRYRNKAEKIPDKHKWFE